MNLMKSSRQSKLKWGGVICLLAGLCAVIFYRLHSPLWIEAVKLYNFLHDPHQLKAMLTSFGPYSPLIFIIIQMTQVVALPIPGGPVEFLGGYLFGAKAGFIYSMIGLTLGSWLAFSIARIFEKWLVEKFVSPKTLKKFDYLIGHQGALISFFLFLIPGFPKDAFCYILGLTPMHLGIFLIISTVGRVPGTLMAALQGAKAFNHQYKIFLILLGISAMVILVFYIYHEKIHQLLKKMK
jgi:uncharacterized membrane protein YdjX (TVP38/TMEM64 family)